MVLTQSQFVFEYPGFFLKPTGFDDYDDLNGMAFMTVLSVSCLINDGAKKILPTILAFNVVAGAFAGPRPHVRHKGRQRGPQGYAGQLQCYLYPGDLLM